MVIELLESAGEATADRAAAFHFGSIAHDNEATDTTEEAGLPAEPLAPPRGCSGTLSRTWGLQAVAKFKEGVRCAYVGMSMSASALLALALVFRILSPRRSPPTRAIDDQCCAVTMITTPSVRICHKSHRHHLRVLSS